MDRPNERAITAATQCRNLERMHAGLRDAMNRLALGKEEARDDVERCLLGIRNQLSAIEDLANRMAEEGIETYKPSFRPVDRIPQANPPPGTAAPLPGSLEGLFRGTGTRGDSRR